MFMQDSTRGYEQTPTKGKTPQYQVKRNHRIHLINSLNCDQELQHLGILVLTFLSKSKYLLLFNRKRCQVVGVSTITYISNLHNEKFWN